MLNQTVGKNIKRLREAKNYSQEAVSSALDISHVTYGKIENGTGVISLERLEKFAEYFQVAIEDLLSFTSKDSYKSMPPPGVLEEKAKGYDQASIELARCKERTRALEEKINMLEAKVEDKELIIDLLTGDTWEKLGEIAKVRLEQRKKKK